MGVFNVLFLKFNTKCHKALDVSCLQSRKILRNIRKIKKNLKQIKTPPILKEEFLLYNFLAKQITGQLIVNFVYTRVHVLSSAERIN